MKGNRMEEIKSDYENIRIPEELRQRVEAGIRQAKDEKEEEKNMKKKSRGNVWVKGITGGVVAALMAITILANSGASIAHAMEKIPVVGAIAKVVTFREYESKTNNMEADIKIPEVAVENEDGSINEEGTAQINKSIEDYTNEIIANFEADVKAAGGEGTLSVDLDYKVVTDNDKLFSIRFDQVVIMAGGNQMVKIYHMDKGTGEMITIGGLFQEGSNYIEAISENIKDQMREQMAADESIHYWLEDEVEEWNFKSITEDTTFYVNEDGKLVIVFNEYDVAPGYMGSVEFEIPTEAVQDMVKDGYLK